ncbi:hypothetical protein ABEG63_14460 [Chryseobacterium sp. C39-AII1]|uniref:hypothetical protein n=1 Tax=Chryseobacterium sp. C39-AII1 TaxID=3080332 RepID=UPI00320A94C2
MSTESTNEKDPLRPGFMSSDLIQTLIDNYRSGHGRAINSTLGIEDANSIWFDLPKLKKFISMIEEEAAKVNPDTTEEDLGIRFYYAAYPKEENWDLMDSHPVEKEYARRHTLVMIPTKKRENDNGEIINADFNPLDNSEENSMQNNSRRTRVSMEVISENNGQLSPPSLTQFELF